MNTKTTLIFNFLYSIRGIYEMEHGLVQHIVKGLQKMNLTSVQNLDFLVSLNKENLRSEKDKKIADLKKENADLQKQIDEFVKDCQTAERGDLVPTSVWDNIENK